MDAGLMVPTMKKGLEEGRRYPRQEELPMGAGGTACKARKEEEIGRGR
jgi:hypothetical protein